MPGMTKDIIYYGLKLAIGMVVLTSLSHENHVYPYKGTIVNIEGRSSGGYFVDILRMDAENGDGYGRSWRTILNTNTINGYSIINNGEWDA